MRQEDFPHSFWAFFKKDYFKVWQTEKVSQISNQLLQSVWKSYYKSITGITKWDKIYYKLWQVLQSVTITKLLFYFVWRTCKYIRLLMFSLSKYFTLNNLFRFTSKRIFSHELICLMVLKSKISLIVHKKNFFRLLF